MLPAFSREGPSSHRRPASGAVASAALVVLLALFVGAAALASLPSAATGEEPVAIIFPFWLSGTEAVARSFEAGDRVLRMGRLPFVVVVAAEGRSPPSPRGAWLSLKMAGLAGCLDASPAAGEPE